MLVVHLAPWLAAGLGDSHDGYNAGMWGLGARGAVEDPIGNRLGGVQPDGTRYANHPPLLVWSLIPVSALNERSTLGLRLVPLAASVAAMGLLVLLLLDAGIGIGAAAGAVIIAGSSAMYLTYGAMVDTPVFGFPFAIAAVWAAQRAWQGRPPPTTLMIAVGMLAAIAGWQALLAAGLAAIVAGVRRHRPSRVGALALACGVLVGALVDVSWTWWVNGGLAALFDQGVARSRMDFGQWFTSQTEFAMDLYGPVLLILVLLGGACAALLRPAVSFDSQRPEEFSDLPSPMDASLRVPDATRRWMTPLPLTLVLVATVVIYAGVFRYGAWVHSYWNYYGVAVVAVTSGALLQMISQATRRFSTHARTLVTSLIVLCVLVIVASGWSRRSQADYEIQAGLDVVPLATQIPTTQSPRDIAASTVGGDPTKPWLRWTTEGRTRPVELSDISSLGADDLVLFTLPFAPSTREQNRTEVATNGRYMLLTAQTLKRMLAN